MAGDINEGDGGDNPPPPSPKVGDYVQWTNNGVDQFVEPRKIVGITDDGEYAYVEGSKTGAPMSELAVLDPPAKKPEGVKSAVAKQPPLNPFYIDAKPAGPMISFPLAKDNVMELRLNARITKKDFERLKSLIDLSEDSLVIEE